MKEFYENLKAKRQENGITLDEIHRSSRLHVSYLKSIESGDLNELPSGYERIYLRRYVQEIGLDAEEVLRDYDLLTGRLTPDESAESEHTSAREAPPPSNVDIPSAGTISKHRIRLLEKLNLDRIHMLLWGALAVLIIAVTGYITYQQYIYEQTNQQMEIREITVSEMIETLQEEDSVLTPEAKDHSVVLSSVQPGIRVELRARERTWLREIIDEKDTSEYILPSSFTREIEAASTIKFLVGRADGVEIWLNNDSLGVLGSADQVITSLVLTSEGISERLIKTVAKDPTPITPDSTNQTNSPDSLSQ